MQIERERRAVLEYLGTDGREIHWDMIGDISEDSEIVMDGDVIYKNGSFQL